MALPVIVVVLLLLAALLLALLFGALGGVWLMVNLINRQDHEDSPSED